jgi:hypothetical protein
VVAGIYFDVGAIAWKQPPILTQVTFSSSISYITIPFGLYPNPDYLKKIGICSSLVKRALPEIDHEFLRFKCRRIVKHFSIHKRKNDFSIPWVAGNQLICLLHTELESFPVKLMPSAGK